MKMCIVCNNEFEPKGKKHVACSANCYAKHWNAQHPGYKKRYYQEWVAANPDKLRGYGVRQLKGGYGTAICLGCGMQFHKNSAPHTFCTPKCNRKFYLVANRERTTATHAVWVSKNKARVNELSKKYLHASMLIHPWKSLLNSTRRRAAKEKIVYDLDATWAEQRWTGHCELTGLPFTPPEKRYGHQSRGFFPSIDRINPTLGYLKSNCRFVLYAVNAFKNNGTDTDMLRVAAALLINNGFSVKIV